jgi:hypothetical protein
MSKFFEEGKFYKFASCEAARNFGSFAGSTNDKIARYIGHSTFEVKVSSNGDSLLVNEIRLPGELDFVDMFHITQSASYHNSAIFASTGTCGHEFEYFVECAANAHGIRPEPPVPVQRWKVLIVENGKIVVHSKHVSREPAHMEATRLILTGTYDECYLLEGEVEKFTVTKKVEVETI